MAASEQEALINKPHVTQTALSPSPVGRWRQKAEVWESILGIDRVLSMMWSLPLATANYVLPKRPIVDSNGQVNPQAYLYNMADIARSVLELDNIYSSGNPTMDLFNAAISTDQELRSLASSAPLGWLKIHWPELCIDALLQYWHQYLTVRTHLQLALKYDEGQQFAFNFIACLEACQQLARRYVSMRPTLPAGFFANQVLDLQVVTASAFLLLASYRNTHGSGTLPQSINGSVTTSLVDQVVQMMVLAANRAGGDFARQGAEAIRSLGILLQQPQTSKSQSAILSLPLIGRIHVSRKACATKTKPGKTFPDPSQQQQGRWQDMSSGGSVPSTQAMPFQSSGLDPMDSISYSMETPEMYPFLTDETFETEQWLTWK